MKDRYSYAATRYECRRCKTPIVIESESFYEFAGVDDSHFWCQTCEDLPAAEIVGIPARELPAVLQLPRGFRLNMVPSAEPGDVSAYSALFRPYTKRSFVRQYAAWLRLTADQRPCAPRPTATSRARFDVERQKYAHEVEVTVVDECGGASCQFLRSLALKPEVVRCGLLRELCSVKGRFGLCETGDEAMLLQHFLLVSGEEEFPMLVPQPAMFRGGRRPDFVAYVPVSRFQYLPVVVLVDRPGKDSGRIAAENEEYSSAGYTVRRVLVGHERSFSYFKSARELVRWMDGLGANAG